MWVFGYAWKINFPKIIFSWSGVLKALTQKWFEVKIFTSNYFRTHAQRKREREREPSTLTSPTSSITAFDFDFADLWIHRSTNRSCLQLHWSRLRLRRLRQSCLQLHRSTNRSSTQSLRPTNLRLCRRLRAFAPRTNLRPFAFDLEPRTHEPISLSLCDFDFLCDCDRPTNPWAFDLWFFVVVVVMWVVVFWWFSCCVVVGFVWVVVENSIFTMLPNTWKYFLEQFS